MPENHSGRPENGRPVHSFRKDGERKPFGGHEASDRSAKPFAKRSEGRSFERKPGERPFAKRDEGRSFEHRPGERPFAKRGEGRSFGTAKPQHSKLTNLQPRRVALDTLLDVSGKGAYASLALEKRLDGAKLSERDRAFVTKLVYGTIEKRIQLDWRIDQYIDKDKELDPTLREILRMGAYQLFCLDRVPDMAAVDESVTLTRAMGLEGLTGLTNAVLRSMIREPEKVVFPKPEEDPVRYLSITFSAPEELCRLLVDAYGEHEAMEILRYKPEGSPVVLRANRMRCPDERLERLLLDEGLNWTRGIVPGTYVIRNAGDLTALRGYANGLYTIQGESSVLAARAIQAQPGQVILDACAAPGGKSAVLSEEMQDSGRVYAWDTHPHRVELIRRTAERLHLENIRPMIRDASQPRPEMDATIDAALVDAPCSGTGVISEKPDLKYRITEDGVRSLCGVQASILEAVAPMVKPGGTLVYSTCSILPAENTQRVRAFLDAHPEYEPYPMGDLLPEAIRGKETAEGLQLLAHQDGMDGFFIARLRRKKK